jgi:nucleoid DNA-binding protein
MNPKKHNEFKKGIAEEVGVHSQLVDDFITFYFSRVRKKLSSLAHPRIYVEGLGTFYLRKKKLEHAIKKQKSMLGNVAKRTYNGYAKSETITSNINEMEKALEVIKNDILSKKKFRGK